MSEPPKSAPNLQARRWVVAGLGLLFAWGLHAGFRAARSHGRARSAQRDGGVLALRHGSARTPADAGVTDAGTTDAGTTDGGVTETDAATPEPFTYVELDGGTLLEHNAALLTNMEHALGLSAEQSAKIRAIFAGSEYIGQGNPKPTRHPLTRAQCLERRAEASRVAPADLRCGAPNMVPLYDPSAGETPASAKACIDQFEFPNIECEYPVVWVRANEAQALCHALDKRLCDAHEWEGACAGAVKSPESEYAFGERRIMMQYLHNKSRELVWSYGKEKNHALCATGSAKGPKCLTPSWTGCGSNDYPAGSFPECVSPLGAYDLNGNAAEHMNFPCIADELGSRGGSGETEMKGSWFIFQHAEAHEDDCRWRAPDWHVTRIDDPNSHRNYHLGFRCCKDLVPVTPRDAGADASTERSAHHASPSSRPEHAGARALADAEVDTNADATHGDTPSERDDAATEAAPPREDAGP